MTPFRTVFFIALLLASSRAGGSNMTSSEIYHELQRLKVTGSVLYVAAHPDDENTTLLSYLAQEEKLETAYLSLTRGGGGQNLIGSELKEELGLIRANELLQARRIDGATQLFTRARDFGYSKNPEDTLENWEEDKILGEVVFAVRSFRPDVIITRFNPAAGPTHGHHTVSAQLAVKAFSLAADPNAFPEQLNRVGTHQAKRIFWNGYGQRGPGGPRGRNSAANESREIVSLEIGKYNPHLGASYTEISARSRSMHKSQGFGRASRRGPQTERLVLLDGEPAEGDFLAGIDTTWKRFQTGAQIDALLEETIETFDYDAPWRIASALLDLDQRVAALPESRFTRSKRAAIRKLVVASLGLHLEARWDGAYLVPGQTGAFSVELVNRSPESVRLRSLEARLFHADSWPRAKTLNRIENLDQLLDRDASSLVSIEFALPMDSPLTQPFWLETAPTTGIYRFSNDRLLELETVPAPLSVVATLEIDGRLVPFEMSVEQVISDPVEGEVRKRVAIRPEIVINPDASLALFEDSGAKRIDVSVTANVDSFNGRLEAVAPKGWSVAIDEPEIALYADNPTQTKRVTVRPPDQSSEGAIAFRVVDKDGRTLGTRSKEIVYDHIGSHPILSSPQTKVARLELARGGTRIACIQGVGDTVPAILERIGYEVDFIEADEIEADRLAGYDTVLIGPRAFDSLTGLDRKFDALLAYVEAGGTLISQYNTTSFRAKSRFTSPYPIRLSRERVSEEKVEMRILKPEHPVFNHPNKINRSDFDNWIQERGLYYASSWDANYDALLSANDRGEPPRDGGLLVAQYGKGWYAYTGLSFFRQLPEGNPGAIRLFVNLISLGHGK